MQNEVNISPTSPVVPENSSENPIQKPEQKSPKFENYLISVLLLLLVSMALFAVTWVPFFLIGIGIYITKGSTIVNTIALGVLNPVYPVGIVAIAGLLPRSIMNKKFNNRAGDRFYKNLIIWGLVPMAVLILIITFFSIATMS